MTLSPTYQQNLAQAGLTQAQALVYEVLLKNGPLPARKVARATPLKRTLVYKVLEELGKIGLVTRKDAPKMVSIFEPAHPMKLKEIVEKKEQQARNAQTALETVLSQLTSDYNLISGKPGVRFFEGIEGAKTVLEDSLTAKSEIYSYVDNESVDRYYPTINEEYVKKRMKSLIKKKMIMIDSEYTRKYEKNTNPAITDIRLIPSQTPFATVMQIYDDKISYISVDPDPKKLIAVIIQHSNIVQMHKTLFETMWSTAKPLFPASAGERTSAKLV